MTGYRNILLHMLSIATVVSNRIIVWKGLGFLTNTESPVVVVLSGSMEPAFYRGDVLFMTNPPSSPFKTGDITVYKIPGVETPIVHRIIETHEDARPPFSNDTRIHTDRQLLLTQGDNNDKDDIPLYQGLEWLERKHIVGKVQAFLPYIGYVTIAMNDIPQLRYAVLGGFGLLALIQPK